MSWSLRPVLPSDRDLLLRLYASVREAELAQVPWSEAQKQAFLLHQITAQERHYRERYPSSEHQIVMVGGEPIGRLWIDRQAERIHILDLILLSPAEESGVDIALLQDLQGEAGTAGKAVTIYLESFSPSLALFERLGFVQEEEQGTHLLLAWRVRTSAPAPALDPSK